VTGSWSGHETSGADHAQRRVDVPNQLYCAGSIRRVIFCRVPLDWLDGDQLKMEKLETVYEALYGKDWRAGNDDGSQYVVLRVEVQMLTAEEEQAAAWRGSSNSDAYQYWFYQVTTAGELQLVEAHDF
jgi:hypothetical protein